MPFTGLDFRSFCPCGQVGKAEEGKHTHGTSLTSLLRMFTGRKLWTIVARHVTPRTSYSTAAQVLFHAYKHKRALVILVTTLPVANQHQLRINTCRQTIEQSITAVMDSRPLRLFFITVLYCPLVARLRTPGVAMN